MKLVLSLLVVVVGLLVLSSWREEREEEKKISGTQIHTGGNEHNLLCPDHDSMSIKKSITDEFQALSRENLTRLMKGFHTTILRKTEHGYACMQSSRHQKDSRLSSLSSKPYKSISCSAWHDVRSAFQQHDQIGLFKEETAEEIMINHLLPHSAPCRSGSREAIGKAWIPSQFRYIVSRYVVANHLSLPH